MGGRGNFRVTSDNSWSSFGGYMNAKVQKLEEQFSETSNNITRLTNIFNKVAIHVNGYTKPTCDELKILMAQHGGKFHSYYSSSSTTHVIASNLPYVKLKELRPNQNVVKPEWITDSIKEGKLLPVHSYLLSVHKTNNTVNLISKFVIQGSLPNSGDETKDTGASSLSNSNLRIPQTTDSSVNTRHKSIAPTADSSFLSEFYSHSRLHFLSTWKTELTEYVRSLTIAEKNNLNGLKRLQSNASQDRYQLQPNEQFIVHLDMDCFFVSVGLLSRPHLQCKAVAVTHHLTSTSSLHAKRPGTDVDYERNYYRRKMNENGASAGKEEHSGAKETNSSDLVPSYSEIASCNYKAREAGLKNGMFYGKAKELCPDLITIPYDFDAYRQISQKLYDILSSYTLQIEAVSCDEALLDITSVVATTGLSPSSIVQQIRKQVKEDTGCDASAGIGPNIVLARMATREGKPNGQYQVKPDEARKFLRNRPVKNLPSVGYATAHRLEEIGVKTCGELLELSLNVLKKEFGVKTGAKLRNFAMGVDARKICSTKERKSVSADVNYGIRLSSDEELQTFLTNLSQEISNRLKKANLAGKKLTLKVMVRRLDAPLDTAKFGGHGVCHSLSRSKALSAYTDDSDSIKVEVIRLMKSLKVNIPDLRGIGIQVTQLKDSSKVKLHSKSTIKEFVKPRSDTHSSSSVNDIAAGSSKVLKNSHQYATTSNDERNVESSECGISASFLDALPKDLREEVTKDWKAHRRMMEAKQHFPVSPRGPSTRSSPSKLAQTKGVRFKKSPAKRKRTVANPKSNTTSPNKLITDLFPVLSKTANQEDRNEIIPESSRRKLIEDASILSKLPTVTSEQVDDFSSPPSLGGATTIPESRDAVRRWVETFLTARPVEEDIDEVKRYLGLLVEDHDIEGACLVLHTLRRSIVKLIDNADVNDTQIDRDDHVKAWTDMYNQIASSLLELVKKLYEGAMLNIKFLS